MAICVAVGAAVFTAFLDKCALNLKTHLFNFFINFALFKYYSIPTRPESCKAILRSSIGVVITIWH